MEKPSILSPFKAIRFLFEKPYTLRYPFEMKEPALRYRGFHLNDWDLCTGCGSCAKICPNEAIEMVGFEEIKPKSGERNERSSPPSAPGLPGAGRRYACQNRTSTSFVASPGLFETRIT